MKQTMKRSLSIMLALMLTLGSGVALVEELDPNAYEPPAGAHDFAQETPTAAPIPETAMPFEAQSLPPVIADVAPDPYPTVQIEPEAEPELQQGSELPSDGQPPIVPEAEQPTGEWPVLAPEVEQPVEEPPVESQPESAQFADLPPVEDQPTEDQPTEQPPVAERSVSVRRVMPDIIRDGDPFRVEATLVGFDGIEYELRWQYNDGSDWKDMSDASDTTVKLVADRDNVNFAWRVFVTIVPAAITEASPEGQLG